MAGNVLSVSVDVKNRGRLPVEAREYCHNFLTINGMALGPDYRLEFEDVKGFDAISGILSASGSGIAVTRYDAVPAYMAVPPEKLARGDAFRWKLSNHAAKACVSVRDEIDICDLAVWAADHMICVESFHKLSLQPGESSSWKRSWTFDTNLQ